MDASSLRKLHNECKRKLIADCVGPTDFVLDCGCGRGGDFWKWKSTKARVAAIDPDAESLKEAAMRASQMQLDVWFLGTGDIRQAAFAGPYTVVCYNFSLQYIFENEKTFNDSIRAISTSLAPGGYLIGIVPEKARAEAMADETGFFQDVLGNRFEIKDDSLDVRIADGPFYADGSKIEPLLDASILIENLAKVGLTKLVWEPMLIVQNGFISDVYSKFVFRKNVR